METQTVDRPLLKVGFYKHPLKGWTLDVDHERIDRLVAAFDRMKADGIDVEVVEDHRSEAAAVLGYVTGLRRQGDWLIGTHELRGERAIDLAERVHNSSVMIEPEYRGGNGTFYGEAILHSSIVTQPVVPGQAAFVPPERIAASMAGADPVPVYSLTGGAERGGYRADPDRVAVAYGLAN